MQPDIYLGSIRIAQPVMALTDLPALLICLYAFIQMRRVGFPSVTSRLFAGFFICMGLSMLTGALLGHAFNYKAGFPGKAISWVFSMVGLAALAQAALERARPFQSVNTWKILTGIGTAGLVLAISRTLSTESFQWVEIFSAFALVGLLAPLEWFLMKRRPDAAGFYLLWSVPVAFLAVLPHIFKWSPSVWFTYFDVGHLIVCGSLWLIMLGALSIPKSTPPL
jgi:hypothetical protein